MKNLCMLLLCATALMWGGCSKDDNEPEPDLRGDAAALVGTWQTMTHKETSYENGKQTETYEYRDEGFFTLELTPDGQYHWREEGDVLSSSDDGWFTYNQETHTFKLQHDVDYGLQEATVTRLTGAVLELSWIEEGEEDAVLWKDENVLTFKRIN